MAINQIIKLGLSDSGSTAAAGILLTDTEIAAKTIAGITNLATIGCTFVSRIAANTSGNGSVYFGSITDHIIGRVNESGQLAVVAGSTGVSGNLFDVSVKDSGGAFRAAFNGPRGIAIDKNGRIYVCDTGNKCIKVIDGDRIDFVAGSTTGVGGFLDGSGSNARFNIPDAIAIDDNGTLYVADLINNAIRKIKNGYVTTMSGTLGTSGNSGDQENVMTSPSTAQFNSPSSIATDAKGNVFIGDSSNNKVKKITPEGRIYLHSGSGVVGTSLGTAPNYSFTCQYQALGLSRMASDKVGNLYVSGSVAATRIMKIDPNGRPSVVADFTGSSVVGKLIGIAVTPNNSIIVAFSGV